MENMNKLHTPYDNILSNKFENNFDSAKIEAKKDLQEFKEELINLFNNK